MNIAVKPEKQGIGFGQKMIGVAIKIASAAGVTKMQVGTGNSSIDQLAFYQKCGFRLASVYPNYFVENYDQEIWENGILCRDKIMLSMVI